MMEFKELLVDIRKELRCADKYAHEAIKHKHDFPELSDLYHRIADDEMTHAEMFSKQAKAMAEKHNMVNVWDVQWYLIKTDMDEVKIAMDGYKG